MKRNKIVIAVFLILILSVLVIGKGVNNPITVNGDNPMFEYIEGDKAFNTLKEALDEKKEGVVLRAEKLPSDKASDYEMLEVDVDMDINTHNKITINHEIVSISGDYEDRIMMVSSIDGKAAVDKQRLKRYTFSEDNYVIYTGGLSEKETEGLKNDLGIKLSYKVGMYKEKEMILSPKDHGASTIRQ